MQNSQGMVFGWVGFYIKTCLHNDGDVLSFTPARKHSFTTASKPPHYAFLIPQLNLELPDFLRQSLYAVFVFPRQVVDFLHRAVNLLYACRHLVHRILDDRRQLV